MKKIILLAMVILGIGNLAQAQDEVNVSAAVLQAFGEKFAGAEYIEWHDQGDQFMASFWIGETAFKEAFFSKSGAWLKTLTTLEEADVSSSILTSIKQKHKGAMIAYVTLIETPEGQVYEIDIETIDNSLRLVVDMNGKIIDTVELEDEEEEGDDGDF